MRNTCFWAALVFRSAAKGGQKRKGKKRERKERKELWYSQPPQTIPPLMCCESRRAARPSRFLNHFLQEGLSTCSPSWFWPGLECKEVGPFRVPLTAFLFTGAPAAEVEVPDARTGGLNGRWQRSRLNSLVPANGPYVSAKTHASLPG